MIDPKFIGHVTDPHVVQVEAGRLRAFAMATGETNPVYTDLKTARDAGYPDLPAPPTFLFTLDLEREDPFYFITMMDIDLARVLHGAQTFTYGVPICAGDEITLISTVTDIQVKKGGTMEIVELDTRATNQRGEDVGGMTRTIVVRHPS